MAIITEVHAISAAAGWVVDEEQPAPVACFALVSTVDPDFPNAGTARVVVPVTAAMLMLDLIGQDTRDLPDVVPATVALR